MFTFFSSRIFIIFSFFIFPIFHVFFIGPSASLLLLLPPPLGLSLGMRATGSRCVMGHLIGRRCLRFAFF